jgi:hypothetical protein
MPILNGALLCDAAHEYNGLVSILGGFVNILYVGTFPAPAPIWYAARVAFDAEEAQEDEHAILVTAYGPEGEMLAQVRGNLQRIEQPPNAQPDLASGMNLVFPFPFIVGREGMHWVELTVNDVSLSRLPLKVIGQQPTQ